MATISDIPSGFKEAPSFGALLDQLLVRYAEGSLFPVAASDSERKEAIMVARERGDITDRQTSMLIESFGLRAS